MHTYPLIGELVEVYQGPSPNYYPKLDGNPDTTVNYYTPSLNVHNNTGNNALPNGENTENYKAGDYFVQNEFQRSLVPSEGDTIIEGKKGQRIRFTSTGPSGTNVVSQGATNEPNDGNPNIGEPAIVISLGSGNYENITQDDASIYILSGQKLPIDTSATNIDSLKSEYSPVQTAEQALEDIPESPEPSTIPPPETEETEPEIDFSDPFPIVESAPPP